MTLLIPSLNDILHSRWGRIVAPFVGLLLVLAAVSFWHGRDARAIHRRLSRLQHLVSKDGDEKPLAQLAQTREVIEYFTQGAVMELGQPMPFLEGRQEIAALFQQARATFRTIDVNIRDQELRLADDRRSAELDMTVEVKAEARGEALHEVRELRLDWMKKDGRWLIARASNVDTIRKPQPVTTP